MVLASQVGLPLDARPSKWIANELCVEPELIAERFKAMLADGRIRRIGVVPNHYRLGYVANGMSVWDVPDEDVEAVGRQVGELDMVNHCYLRPCFLPEWPYNLFGMVHGHDKDEVRTQQGRANRAPDWQPRWRVQANVNPQPHFIDRRAMWTLTQINTETVVQ